MAIPQEIIRKKRHAEHLTTSEIQSFVEGITHGSWSNEQISALAMAIYFQSMSPVECADLTSSMRDSGEVLDWSFLKDLGPVVDKHSTGGVGDKVSVMLSPIMAACGAYIPMICGRGLGHTGGTVDKLESIPGYRTDLPFDLFQKQTKELGVSVIGQTQNLAPADRRFYSIRSITSTVESIPLITASILSKKLAAGLDNLVLDVKFGNGAFLKNMDETQKLAKSLETVGNQAGCKTKAVLTDMNQILGFMAGNSLEIMEAVEFMKNPSKANERLYDVTLTLCEELLVLSGLCTDLEAARSLIETKLHSGEVLEKFAKMAHAQGASADFCDRYRDYLPKADLKRTIKAKKNGYVGHINTHQLGVAIIELGGGRKFKADEAIDHRVGIEMKTELGQEVKDGEDMMILHGQSEDQLDIAEKMVHEAIDLQEEKPTLGPDVIRIML